MGEWNDHNTSSLKDLVDAMLKAYGIDKKMERVDVFNTWHSVMGKSVSKRTENIFYKDNKLFVKISSSVLRDELNRMKEAIVEKLNESLGKKMVEELILR